jgi:hypothetical protein
MVNTLHLVQPFVHDFMMSIQDLFPISSADREATAFGLSLVYPLRPQIEAAGICIDDSGHVILEPQYERSYIVELKANLVGAEFKEDDLIDLTVLVLDRDTLLFESRLKMTENIKHKLNIAIILPTVVRQFDFHVFVFELEGLAELLKEVFVHELLH